MTRLIILLIFALLCLSLSGTASAEPQCSRLVLATTGETICTNVTVDGKDLYVPPSVLGSLGVRYVVSGTTLKIKTGRAQSITLVKKSNVKMMRLDEVADVLEFDYSFDKKTSTVFLLARLKSVELKGSILHAVFTGPVSTPSIKVWPDPWRIAIDVHGTRLAAINKKTPIQKGNLNCIRLGQFTEDTSRIVLDMTEETTYRLIPSASTHEIAIELGDSPAPSQKPQSLHKVNNSSSLKGLVVVIDPGHGGTDPGSMAEGVCEKNINLEIAEAVKLKLVKTGAKVILTREDDCFVDLEDRVALAAQHSAGIFISLHCNASEPDSATGVEIYYSDYPGSCQLACIVQEALVQATGTNDRHVRPSPGFTVLQNVTSPSILVECGFIDSKIDRELLCDGAYQSKLADAILKGLKVYRAALVHIDSIDKGKIPNSN